MRSKSLIKNCLPCDTNYADKTIQTIADVKAKGPVKCPNFAQCKARSKPENIKCAWRIAHLMAGFALPENGSSMTDLSIRLLQERLNFLDEAPDGKFWVFRNKEWQVVTGKKNVIDGIIVFAKVILDAPEINVISITGQRRKKTTPERPADAVNNALTDIAELYEKIGVF